MEEGTDHPACGAPVLQSVLLVDRYERPQGMRYAGSSLPGHLLHLVVSGRVRQEVNGREYDLRPHTLCWYHEDESVRGEVIEGPWVFYTVNFTAPALSPPPFEGRLRTVDAGIAQRFERLLEDWQRPEQPGVREMRVQGGLLSLLAEVWTGEGQPFRINPAASLWWEIETLVRRDLSQPLDLPQLVRLSGRSEATIARSCRSAVGASPMKRIKQIRMSLGRGLVLHSDLPISSIAGRVGYERIHEFSRDYRRHFDAAPTDDRRRLRT